MSNRDFPNIKCQSEFDMPESFKMTGGGIVIENAVWNLNTYTVYIYDVMYTLNIVSHRLYQRISLEFGT